MINKFGVQNFKAFKDKVELDIKPLTIFTGTNSSGKSSFTQAIRLFNHITPIDEEAGELFKLQFNGELALLGDFDSVRPSLDQPIVFTKPSSWPGLEEEISLEISISKDLSKQSPYGQLESFKIFSESRELLFEYQVHGIEVIEVADFEGDTYEREYLNTKTFINIPYLREKFDTIHKNLVQYIESWRKLNDFFELIGKGGEYMSKRSRQEIKSFYESLHTDEELDSHFYEFMNYTEDYKEPDNTIRWKIKNSFVSGSGIKLVKDESNMKMIYKYNPDSTLMDYKINGNDPTHQDIFELKEIESQKKSWLIDGFSKHFFDLNFGDDASDFFGDTPYEEWKNHITKQLLLDSVEVKEGLNFKIFLEGFVGKGLKYVVENNFIRLIDKPIEYIPSIRTIPTRFISRNNLNTYLEKLINSLDKPDKQAEENLNYWVKEFGIADKVEIVSINEVGVSQIKLIKDSKELNLGDVGYGVSQLIPILIRLCLYHDELVIIEEPETNLHPALQSKLADFLVSRMFEFNRIIVETHSEFLIRKLQYLVAKKDVKSQDCVIYYFNADENVIETEPKIKKIEITEEGNLTDNFGPGFFDEATRLQFELLKLNRNQSN